MIQQNTLLSMLTWVYSSTQDCHLALHRPLPFFNGLWIKFYVEFPASCYIDDILITGKTESEHLERLEAVLKRLREYGLRLRKDTCEYMLSTVEYLGHLIDAVGLHPLPSKVEVIVNTPAPTNVQQLRAFLGLVNYCSESVYYSVPSKQATWKERQMEMDPTVL